MAKVLITHDAVGWCWHRRAQALKKYMPDEVTVELGTPALRRQVGEYDEVLWQEWWSAPPDVWVLVANEGVIYDYNPKAEYLPARTASRLKNRKVASAVLPRAKGILCINPKEEVINFCQSLNKNTHYLQVGIDLDMWLQKTKPPIREGLAEPERIRIGWCGKPSTPDKWSPKGYQEILIPVMKFLNHLKQFSDMEMNIEWCTNTRDITSAFSQKSMDRWYRSLDLFICTSCSEGTPNTVLEALACMCPVIMTEVGLADKLNFASDFYSHPSVQVISTWHDEPTADRAGVELCLAIQKFIQEERWCSWGIYARKMIDKYFNWKTIAPVWSEVINA